VVREALAAELTANGHVIVPRARDLLLDVFVDEFSVETVPSYKSMQYIARVAIGVWVFDAERGDTLLRRRYLGTRRVEGPPDQEVIQRDVMTTALTRAVRDFATDPERVVAFARRLAAVGGSVTR
jgi:hypothetical protein